MSRLCWPLRKIHSASSTSRYNNSHRVPTGLVQVPWSPPNLTHFVPEQRPMSDLSSNPNNTPIIPEPPPLPDLSYLAEFKPIIPEPPSAATLPTFIPQLTPSVADTPPLRELEFGEPSVVSGLRNIATLEYENSRLRVENAFLRRRIDKIEAGQCDHPLDQPTTIGCYYC